MPPPTSKRTKLAYGTLVGAGLLAGFVLFVFDPATTSAYPGCPLHSLTGLDCPTCGGLRATHLLLHGQIRAAFTLNPLLFFALPIIALFCLRPALARPRWIPWAALTILIAWFVWRNWA